jgi:hypothetical protein
LNREPQEATAGRCELRAQFTLCRWLFFLLDISQIATLRVAHRDKYLISLNGMSAPQLGDASSNDQDRKKYSDVSSGVFDPDYGRTLRDR